MDFTLQELTIIPERDEHNNPVWSFPVMAKVYRQDNTLSLQEHAGTLSNDEVEANVSHIYGGFVFGLSVRRKVKGKPYGDTEQYALDCRPILEAIINLNLELRKVPRLPRLKASTRGVLKGKVKHAKARHRANPRTGNRPSASR